MKILTKFEVRYLPWSFLLYIMLICITQYVQSATLGWNHHCLKSVRIRCFPGPWFPAFVLNEERYGVSLRIQSECREIWTKKIPNTDTFYAVMLNSWNKCKVEMLVVKHINRLFHWFLLYWILPISVPCGHLRISNNKVKQANTESFKGLYLNPYGFY